MHCEEYLPLIEKLVDGECSASEKTRVEAHLAVCEACREHFEFLKALPEAARRVPLPEPPGAYWEVLPRKVMARIEQKKTGRSSPGRLAVWLAPSRLRWLGAAAAGIIALVVSVEVLVLRDEEPAPERPGVATSTPPVAQPSPETMPVEDRELPADEDSAPPSTVAGLSEEGTFQRNVTGVPSPDEPAVAGKRLPEAVGAVVQEKQKSLDVEAPKSVPPIEADRLSPQSGSESMADKPAEPPGEAGTGQRAPAPGKPQAAQAAEPTALGLAAGESPAAKSRTEMRRDKKEALEQASELDSYRKQSYEMTLGETTHLSEVELEARCNLWRESLARELDGDELIEARYRLAVCSIQLYRLRHTEERRTRALEDASAFLEIAPEGEKADQIRSGVNRIQKDTVPRR